MTNPYQEPFKLAERYDEPLTSDQLFDTQQQYEESQVRLGQLVDLDELEGE